MTHHPHVHMIVPGGGISLDGTRWIGCRPNSLLPVRVLSRLFRRLMLEMLLAAHGASRLQFLGDHAHLADKAAFKAYLAPLHRTKWFVYSKRPFAGPQAVLAYLARYTHRVAISNSRLIAADETGVTFRYKDYRIKGPGRYKTMTLATSEFIRRPTRRPTHARAVAVACVSSRPSRPVVGLGITQPPLPLESTPHDPDHANTHRHEKIFNLSVHDRQRRGLLSACLGSATRAPINPRSSRS